MSVWRPSRFCFRVVGRRTAARKAALLHHQHRVVALEHVSRCARRLRREDDRYKWGCSTPRRRGGALAAVEPRRPTRARARRPQAPRWRGPGHANARRAHPLHAAAHERRALRARSARERAPRRMANVRAAALSARSPVRIALDVLVGAGRLLLLRWSERELCRTCARARPRARDQVGRRAAADGEKRVRRTASHRGMLARAQPPASA